MIYPCSSFWSSIYVYSLNYEMLSGYHKWKLIANDSQKYMTMVV